MRQRREGFATNQDAGYDTLHSVDYLGYHQLPGRARQAESWYRDLLQSCDCITTDDLAR